MPEKSVLLAVAVLSLLILWTGCGNDDEATASEKLSDDDDDNNDDNDDDDSSPVDPYRKVDNEYADLFAAVYRRLLTESRIVNGDDQEDYGDSAAFCCALIFTWAKNGKATEEELAFATRLMTAYREKVDRFTANPLVILLDSDLAMEIYIGVLGLLVAYEAQPQSETLACMDAYFDAILGLTDMLGETIYYLPIPPYGPTTIKAGLAAMLLHYPLATGGGGRAAERTAQGLAVLEEMDRMVWDEALGGYRYLAFDNHAYVYQYSNVTAIQALVRAYRLTGRTFYLDRAETVAAGLEVLFSEEYGAYFASDESCPRAPHSGEEYIALSGQNYAIYDDLLLFRETGNDEYQRRALTLFDFARDVLFVEEENICFHDIQHGVLAEWYCTGCNWQLLYNLALLDDLRAGIDLLPPAPKCDRP